MGFRTGAYAKVWEVAPVKDTMTKLRLSVSYKNKQTGEYVQDFSGYVMCVGTAVARNAAQLKEGDRIKLGECDVSTRYDAKVKKLYTNFKIFSFENTKDGSSSTPSMDEPQPAVGDGEVDDSRLPF